MKIYGVVAILTCLQLLQFDNRKMSQPSGSSDSQSQSAIALKTWEMANKIETINTIDEIYRYDKQQQQDILTAKPWEKE